ncbi:MAG: DUF2490 domain-containing protein [Verrucomicrobiota bacterium JB022]|nr:DUF2490 domain-containing protein [Verrucomicrobiota bacterium JB022]
MSRISNILTLLALLLGSAACLKAEPTQYWAAWAFDVWESGDFSTQTNLENRHTDGLKLDYLRLTQKFEYQLNDTWAFVISPTIESQRRPGDWRETYRLEFELNPTFKLTDRLSLKLRNRYEARRREGSGNEAFDRFRHRTMLTYKAAWLPGMTSVSIANEIYYDFNAERLMTNRFYPVMLGFKINDHIKASTYYMYQSGRTAVQSDDWAGFHVIGVSSTFSF